MQSVTIQGTLRSPNGTSGAKKIRKEGMVPCVMYSDGEDALHFTADPKEINQLIYTDEFRKATVSVDGQEYECILKNAQFDPVTDRLLHVDFQKLVAGTKLTVSVPVRLTGFAEGVQAGGRLDLKIRKLRIKALPKDLVDHIELDVTHLTLGKSIKVREIELDNIEIMNAGGSPVAQVTIPRALRGGGADEEEETATAEEGAEGAEGAEAAGEQAAE